MINFTERGGIKFLYIKRPLLKFNRYEYIIYNIYVYSVNVRLNIVYNTVEHFKNLLPFTRHTVNLIVSGLFHYRRKQQLKADF